MCGVCTKELGPFLIESLLLLECWQGLVTEVK